MNPRGSGAFCFRKLAVVDYIKIGLFRLSISCVSFSRIMVQVPQRLTILPKTEYFLEQVFFVCCMLLWQFPETLLTSYGCFTVDHAAIPKVLLAYLMHVLKYKQSGPLNKAACSQPEKASWCHQLVQQHHAAYRINKQSFSNYLNIFQKWWVFLIHLQVLSVTPVNVTWPLYKVNNAA